MSSELTYLFDLYDPRTMSLGATLIDTNTIVGREDSGPSHPGDFKSLLDVLCFYPLAIDTQDKFGDGDSPILSNLWVNGFVKTNSGIPLRGVSKDFKNWLNEKNYVCFQQQSNKSPRTLNTLFSHFKWFRSHKKLILSDELRDKDSADKLYRTGLVSSYWSESPLSVRYILRKSGTSKNPTDFLYLIGGSDSLLDHENFDNYYQTIHETYKKIKNSRFDRRLIEVVWEANVNIKDVANNTNILTAMNFTRFIYGIVYIRNFLEYASRILGEDNFDIIELNSDISENMTIVESLQEIKKPYDDIYNFIKTIALTHNDILRTEYV